MAACLQIARRETAGILFFGHCYRQVGSEKEVTFRCRLCSSSKWKALLKYRPANRDNAHMIKAHGFVAPVLPRQREKPTHCC